MLIFVDKYIWDSEKMLSFQNSFRSEDVLKKINDAISAVDNDVNDAMRLFMECLKDAAECMKKRVCVNGRRKGFDWFDEECKAQRRLVRKLLKKFRRSLEAHDRVSFCQVRRQYKNLIFRKKRQYNQTMIDTLVSSVNCQKEFWDNVHKIIPKRKTVKNQISADDWYKHFKNLLEEDVLDDVSNDDEYELYNELSFNRPISIEEVLLALRKLKLKKAEGPDGIGGEILKYAADFIAPFLVKIFNTLFDKGVYPESWCESIILPLYKKGDINDPGNYRGISLSNTCSKVFGFIINRRLQTWVEENNITGECQAGFKRGYSTVDHIFTLLACVQKQFVKNRKLYVAFIDFQKCFDSINRNLLWHVLLKNGIKGKLLGCVKSMYVSVKARVRCGAKLSQSIMCSRGVKQGDVCSPILCSLFINELAVDVIRNGRHGVQFSIDPFVLFILLLADDIVLLSETIVGLQSQLNSLHRSACALDLKVNLEKSNIVVFRKGGYLAAREIWYFDGVVMPVVNAYKYLGIYFSTKLSFTAACRELSSKAKKALLCIIQKLRFFNNHSLDVLLKLFDCQVQPILQYGSEIWGFDSAAQLCEKVHLFALKKFLNVNPRTPNDLVYKELNRYPIHLNSIVNCLRFWFKLIAMTEDRIPKKAYLMLKDLDVKGKKTWVTNIRTCLYQNGFGFIWESQSVGNVKLFLRIFKQRLIDCRWQNVNVHFNESERFSVYKLICSPCNSIPKYICIDVDRQLKYVFTKLRFGVSDLRVHFYRYRHCRPQDLICPLCMNGVEDEVHFLLSCPFYEELRSELIPRKYYSSPCLFRMQLLLASTSITVVKNLCIYTYKSFKMREIALL